MITPAALALHVQQLCSDNGITVLERTRYGGVAVKRTRTIAIKPVKTQRTYIVALHEIGHIIGPGRHGTRLEEEAAAWDFVLAHTIVPLAPSTYQRMLIYLESYLHRAQRRKRMVVPPPEHHFWETYHTIKVRASD